MAVLKLPVVVVVLKEVITLEQEVKVVEKRVNYE